MKCVKKTVRHYWKYQYESWTQPVLSSDITNVQEGIIETTANSSYPSWNPYKALNGIKSGSSANGWRTNNTTTGWWKIKFPYKILITGLVHYNAYAQSNAKNVSGRFYTDETLATPIGDSISTPNTNWYRTEITGIPASGIYTDTIYFNKTTSAAYGGIGELEITANRVSVIKSTQDDYDFYTDDEVALLPKISDKFYGINQ